VEAPEAAKCGEVLLFRVLMGDAEQGDNREVIGRVLERAARVALQ
jgi:hypothetical protein